MIGNIIAVNFCFFGGFIVVNGLIITSFRVVLNDGCQINDFEDFVFSFKVTLEFRVLITNNTTVNVIHETSGNVQKY